jgi:hypothetical protein
MFDVFKGRKQTVLITVTWRERKRESRGGVGKRKVRVARGENPCLKQRISNS